MMESNNSTCRFADVYVNTPVNQSFTYNIPAGMSVTSGIRVRVNFSGRDETGFVIRTHNIEPEGIELKDIISPIDDKPIFDERLIQLAEYISESYLSSIGEVLAKALPASPRSTSISKLSQAQGEDFRQKGIELTLKQGEVYESIKSSDKRVHLIFGITGSGKTEIYMSAAADAISKGLSVIYLVPEITISSQIYSRLYKKFGADLIVYHSGLTQNQRLANWKKFYSGEAKIAVGTRSAIFLQCPGLGLVIVDEEHDGSYKEHSTPRYSAKRIAFYRSETTGACLILGSATPSIETLYAAENGIIKLHRLEDRYGDAKLPEIEIVKINKGNEEITPRLKLLTNRTIKGGKQVIYLLNRRGFAPFVLCGDCGLSIECPDCNIGMNYHKGRGMLCHYCGYSSDIPQHCPKCGSESILKLGAGTQRIEDIVTKEFPDYRVFRVDQDSARKKDKIYDLSEMMDKGEIDILLGTQMISKGFDFHGVTLAGIILADIGLNMPDFRATERVFSLLMQLAGRPGRGGSESRVIIQTLNDEHIIFDYLKKQDYLGFYREELKLRKLMNYPPFSRLARLVIRGKDEDKVRENAEELARVMKGNYEANNKHISILGPSPAPLSKIGGNYRCHIVLKGRRLSEITSFIRSALLLYKAKSVYVEIDIDPVDMM
ncbi:MAG: primosomal protein N' [Leptospirales bacterium]|nr:primosomal protein N' [Leptospirales bacterium]